MTACNCSICSKKAYLWIFPVKSQLEIEKGEETLSEYQFGQKNITYKAGIVKSKGIEAMLTMVVLSNLWDSYKRSPT